MWLVRSTHAVAAAGQRRRSAAVSTSETGLAALAGPNAVPPGTESRSAARASAACAARAWAPWDGLAAGAARQLPASAGPPG